jgi:anaphase-promoting complex subunit 2
MLENIMASIKYLVSRQWWFCEQAVPLRFLSVMLAASGTPSHFTKTSPSAFPSPLTSTPVLASGADKTVTERVIRWRLRLQFFAYETLGDLRISELFDVIVDYPER